VALAGDDKRLDRQLLGRALLNDIGVCFDGPHGYFVHREQAVPLLNDLWKFGFFDDQGIEKIPFWRSQSCVRYGGKEPAPEVYVTVYRRPLEGGKGFKAFFVIMNESKRPVELPLTLVDPKRILGGPNALTVAKVRGLTAVPDGLKDWWAGLSRRDSAAAVLLDFETKDIVARADGSPETYGPVFVPYHDYRILYGTGSP
jgi:hypothetical protein